MWCQLTETRYSRFLSEVQNRSGPGPGQAGVILNGTDAHLAVLPAELLSTTRIR